MAAEYRFIPFAVEAKPGVNATAAAIAELDHMVAVQGAAGFEYCRMDHFSVVQPPGCLGFIMGDRKRAFTCNVAVFRRAK